MLKNQKSMTRPSVLTNEGFSLIELMIVGAIVGILLVGVMSLFNYQSKVNQTGGINAQVNQIKAQIQTWISTQDSCDYTFQGMSAGQSIPAFKGSRTGTPADNLLTVGPTGARFPGTNWQIASATLLSAAQIIGNPQISGIKPWVQSDGSATGVLQVTLRLQEGALGSSSPVPAGKGSFMGGPTKTLYFTIPAVFGEAVLVNTAACNSLNTTLNETNGGRCCLNCPTNVTTGATYASDYGATMGGSPAVPYNTATNPVHFASDYNSSAPPLYGCATDNATSPPTYQGFCYIYNYNLRIMNCNSAIKNPLINN